MRRQPFRLPSESAGPFRGSAIDRQTPIRFRLDGRSINGFAGDTVLSAALAAGIDTLGTVDGSPFALGPSSAPTICVAGSTDPLPMERTLATDGAEYVTGARVSRLRRLFGGTSLNLDREPTNSIVSPDAGDLPQHDASAGVVVVGAGVAGLTAALAGARAGLSVTLLEARTRPGGHAVLFGRQEGEDQPEIAIANLVTAVVESDAITLVTGAEVTIARPGLVRAHAVRVVDGTPQAYWLEITAPRIVLATGSIERLPVFPGNRLPRVRGALEAFELAARFGVWPGREAIVATGSSVAYRLAMLVADAGIRVTRILDTRPNPESRFIAFSRAYGITQAPGSRVGTAAYARGRLRLTPESSLPGPQLSRPELAADSLVASGGWQPDLTLWSGSGGASRWNPERRRIEPTGGMDGMVLAGSAAGWLSRTACAASGLDAVAVLLGRPRPGVAELSIDPVYDTPDDPAAIASSAAAPSYLGSGRHLFQRPAGAVARRWPWQRSFASGALTDTPVPLDLGIVAASVQLGLVPPAAAGAVAQERTGLALSRTVPAEASPPRAPTLLPDYLVGRFGGRGQVWVVMPMEDRMLDPGSLIHPDPDHTDPLGAIGVVVRPVHEGAIALLDGAAATEGRRVVLRDGSRTVSLRLVAPYEKGMDLVAAVSRVAGTP